MTENIIQKEILRAEYTARINRVIDYIEVHLDENLSLETLAQVANFSRFHFHRIFTFMIGETLSQYIQRLRIQRAANQLVYNAKKSITEIALDCGFSSSAAFARVFKETFNMTASEWRAGGYLQESKICETDRKTNQSIGKNWEGPHVFSMFIDTVTHNPTWRIKMINREEIQVEVKDMPAWDVAYVRHIGPYQGDSALFEGLMNKLMRWAGPRGLIRFPETQMLSVYYDDPEITDNAKLRVDMCITVPEDTQVDGEIGKMTIPGGRYAVGRFELLKEEYGEAWKFIFGEWLPESGYQPDDRPSFEMYLNNPEEHPEKKCIVNICVPVKPL